MKNSPRKYAFASILILACLAATSLAGATDVAAAGDTRVAKWKGDKTAAFMLMFDDSWPSHFQVAAPALEERGMTATFYINPGKGEYKACSNEWVKTVWRKGMVYGNHTYAILRRAAHAGDAYARKLAVLRVLAGRIQHRPHDIGRLGSLRRASRREAFCAFPGFLAAEVDAAKTRFFGIGSGPCFSNGGMNWGEERRDDGTMWRQGLRRVGQPLGLSTPVEKQPCRKIRPHVYRDAASHGIRRLSSKTMSRS